MTTTTQDQENFRTTLLQKYQLTEEQLTQLIHQQKPELQQTFPISILRTSELSSLEALVKYLRENKKQSYKKIGEYLNRQPKTLAVTYSQAHKKLPTPFPTRTEYENNRLPFTIFQQPLSILETITHQLHNQELTNSEIATKLGLNQRTIWTLLKRAHHKLHGVHA